MQSRFHDWSDARIFLAVVRTGSTLAASRDLGITQTTVARRIDGLEHKLGICLFERDTRGFHPTKDAGLLVNAAEAMEAASLEFETAAEKVRNAQSGTIRFTAAGHAMNAEFGAIFADFSETNPAVTFEFLATEDFVDLAGGGADVALRLTAEIADENLICRRVGETKWTYYASKAYIAANGTPDEMSDDMEPHTVVLLQHIKSNRKNILKCKSDADVFMALRSSRGIGPLPVIDGDLEEGLVRCFPPPLGSELHFWLLASPVAYRRPDVRRFMTFAAPRFAIILSELGSVSPD